MQLLGQDIRLVLFDLDGTLIDSTSLWQDIDYRFFAKRGMEVPPHYGQQIVHMGLEKGALWTAEKYLPNEDPIAIHQEWKNMSVKAYEEEIQLKPYAKEVLELFYKAGVPLILVTASPHDLYFPCITRLNIASYFDRIIDVKAAGKGKSDPHIYDLASSHYGLEPKNVLVFEDALEAIVTASNAGYVVYGVYDKVMTKDRAKAEKASTLFIDDWKSFIERLKAE